MNIIFNNYININILLLDLSIILFYNIIEYMILFYKLYMIANLIL